MIKKFKVELLILSILLISIFIFHNVDIGLYNFFKDFDNSLHSIYLKEFFIQITILGDSKWYFMLSLFFIVLGFLLRGRKYFNKYKHIIDIKISFSIFLFFSLITTGILVQLLKHTIGRPRPNHITSEQHIGFDFFNLSSEFHSFPSGHTSTIFVLALMISYFLPKLKYFVFFLAGIVAFSRVVVGAHFFTDIIGGIVFAYVGVKITRLFLKKNKLIKINNNKLEINSIINDIYLSDKIFFSFAVLFCLIIFFAIGSSIDVYLSSLFYFGKNQFLLQEHYIITIFFKKILLRALIVYILILPIVSLWLPIQWLYFDYKFTIKRIIFLWLSTLFNLLIVVNLLLKNLWGRARPENILQLDGKENFTPWYQISDSCNVNCSFVSGDAATGFAIISLYFLTKKEVYFWLSIIMGFLLGLIRIMEGAHFSSDIVMAAMVVYVAYFFQIKYFFKKQ